MAANGGTQAPQQGSRWVAGGIWTLMTIFINAECISKSPPSVKTKQEAGNENADSLRLLLLYIIFSLNSTSE